MKQELKDFDQQGVELWLDGNISSPKKIVKACRLAEEGSYMRDYVANEKGAICEIRFDLVKIK